MPHFTNQSLEVTLYAVAAIVLLFLGYRAGRWIGAMIHAKAMTQKAQDLFTTQNGFRVPATLSRNGMPFESETGINRRRDRG